MLIKSRIKDVVLNQLEDLGINLSDRDIDYIYIDGNKDTDDFEGNIYLHDSNCRSYAFCVELEDNIFSLVGLKETKAQFNTKLVYSINGEK